MNKETGDSSIIPIEVVESTHRSRHIINQPIFCMRQKLIKCLWFGQKYVNGSPNANKKKHIFKPAPSFFKH